jgi:hypothetical protein
MGSTTYSILVSRSTQYLLVSAGFGRIWQEFSAVLIVTQNTVRSTGYGNRY